MSEPTRRETIQGIEHFRKRLDSHGLRILDQQEMRFGNVYFEIGTQRHRTALTLSREFLDDLPNTKEYHKSIDLYVAAVHGREKIGPIDLFYCRNNVAVQIEIDWPLRAGPDSTGNFVTAALVNVTNVESKSVALCAVHVQSRRRPLLDSISAIINSIRNAVDSFGLQFYSPTERQEQYQRVAFIELFPTRSQQEIKDFIAGKAFTLGNVDGIAEVWAMDPWDAEYLGALPKDLHNAMRVLRSEDLLKSNSSQQEYVQSTDKLVASILHGSNKKSKAAKVKLSRLGLPTKSELEKDLADVSPDETVGLVVLDLDNFKAVNDAAESHDTGDQCLDTVVNLIADIIGKRGTLYRWGSGDEFAVLLFDNSTEEAVATGERIRRAIDSAGPGGAVKVTVSVGVCGTDCSEVDRPTDIIRLADKAVYKSKKDGKNRVTAYRAPI